MLGVVAFMLTALVVPGGAWGATLDDVRAEMAKSPSPFWGTRLSLRVPMVGSGIPLVSLADVCVSGGRLRPTGGSAATIDVGPVSPGNQYGVQVFLRDAVANEMFLYERKVALPDCK
jgi:hypothetical protein